MRILVVTPFYPPQIGVLATYAEGIGRGLKARGHEVQVIASSGFFPLGIRHGVDLVRIALAARNIDYILSLDTWSVGLSAYAASRICRVPISFRIGGDALWESYIERTREPICVSEWYGARRKLSWKEWLMQKWFAYFTHRSLLFFNSRFQMKLWQRAYEIPEKNMQFLENFYPSYAPSASNGTVFRAASRGAFFKNQELLARAFSRAEERYPSITLDTDVVTYAEQKKRLASCYAVIVPSISEVNSNTVIEAAAFGKPFIMSSDSGMGDTLQGGGIFVDTRNEDALVEAIETMLLPDVYRKYQQSIATNWRERSWEEVAEDIEMLLKKCCNERN